MGMTSVWASWNVVVWHMAPAAVNGRRTHRRWWRPPGRSLASAGRARWLEASAKSPPEIGMTWMRHECKQAWHEFCATHARVDSRRQIENVVE